MALIGPLWPLNSFNRGDDLDEDDEEWGEGEGDVTRMSQRRISVSSPPVRRAEESFDHVHADIP